MAKKTKQNNNTLVIILKLLGTIISVGALLYFAYIVAHVYLAASAAYIVHDEARTVTEIFTSTHQHMYQDVLLYGGIYLVLELINYIMYLLKKEKVLLITIIVEIAVVLLINISNLSIIISRPEMLMFIPPINGLINYIILKTNN